MSSRFRIPSSVSSDSEMARIEPQSPFFLYTNPPLSLADLGHGLASTNVIESAFSIVERVCANVKRWHAGDQRERWVGSGLMIAER